MMVNYPSKEECYRLLEEQHVPKNIVRHSEQVAKVAVFLGKKFIEKGINVDIGLLESAGLLHDIARTIDFTGKCKFYNKPSAAELKSWKKLCERYPGMRHNQAGFEMFKDRYPELALIIRKHTYSSVISIDKPHTWEEKLFNYADKRVAHSEIVTLDYRNKEGKERNIREREFCEIDEKMLEQINNMHKDIEKEIFGILHLNPEKLPEYIEKEEEK